MKPEPQPQPEDVRPESLAQARREAEAIKDAALSQSPSQQAPQLAQLVQQAQALKTLTCRNCRPNKAPVAVLLPCAHTFCLACARRPECLACWTPVTGLVDLQSGTIERPGQSSAAV